MPTQPLRPTLPFPPPRLLALLGTIWGLMFIATGDNKPEEKARNFKKDVERGKHFISRKISLPRRGAASDAEGTGEEQPNWDIVHGGRLPATEKATGVRASNNERAV